MIKEFLSGKHETIDFCESKGNSFMIPKAKKIERVNSGNSIPFLVSRSSSWEHDYNDSRDSTPKLYGTPSTYGTPSPYQTNQRPPSFTSCLCDPPSSPFSQDSDSMSCYSDSVPKYKSIQTIKDIEQNKYIWRRQISPPNASNTTRSSSIPTNSSNSSEPTNDSTPPSRVGRRRRWERRVCYDPYDSFNSFEQKKWIWRDFPKTPPRSIPMTPIVSNRNIPPPILKKL